MRRLPQPYREVVQLVLSVAVAVLSGAAMVGQPARLVHVLALSAGALGAGITVGQFVERRRRRRASPEGTAGGT